MSSQFKARLTMDVQYLDFAGTLCTVKAGHPVTIAQVRTTGIVSLDAQGQRVPESTDAFIASSGSLSFDVSRVQFEIEN